MFDVIVIGAGPAGISAALYARRANLNVLVLYHGKSNIELAEKIDNYYGFPHGVSGNQLYLSGIEQAKNIGVNVINEEVLDIKIVDNSTDSVPNNSFTIITTNNIYEGRSVIIATGNKKLRPEIIGIAEFEGKGISYCAVCDGFFYIEKNIAIIGAGDYALHEAGLLENIVNKITILTNGISTSLLDSLSLNISSIDSSSLDSINQVTNNEKNESKYMIIDKVIKEIKGDNKVSSIVFEDGTMIDVDGVFVAIGEAGAVDFARKLGIIMNEDIICVDENMRTNIPGIYACGNVSGGLLQISKAVYEGTIAGLDIINYLQNI